MKKFSIKLFLRVLNLLGKRKWGYIAATIICAAIEPFYQIGFAFANKFIFNSVEYQNSAMLFRGFSLIAIIFLVYCIVQPIAAYYYEGKMYYPIIDIHLKLMSNIIKLPSSFFDKTHSGNIMSRLTSDLDRLSVFYKEYTYDVTTQTMLGIGSLISLIILDIRFVPIVVLLGIITIFLNRIFGNKLYILSKKIQEHTGKSNEWFSDMLSGLRTIKVFGMEKKILNSFKKEYDDVTKNSIALNDLNGKKDSMNFLLSALSFVGILAVGVIMINYKLTDIGTVMAVIVLQGGVTSLFINIRGYINNFQSSLAGAERIFELIDKTKEKSGINHIDFANTNAGINLLNISFEYNDNECVFDGLNLTFDKGLVSALVGESGSGKSTIFKLLLGLYKQHSGEILIFGNNLSDCRLDEIRSIIGYVPQTPYIFNDTIYENIRYGRLDATEEEIINAGKAANAHDFIQNTSGGYRSYIGEGGIRLSGGQCQRIELARIFLKNSPIILLDEATSSLDSKSESVIQEALHRLFKERTVIVIAHRLSTIENADRIYVLDKGTIAESGPHNELLNKKGAYYNMWRFKTVFH